ncbi:hypothetical protein LTR37_015929 [Vermiconidia calcicola]|uniref:Uncharacterized protein n=1 Tax=Vermiconidia calcicola TaxID=1690605 RepID=A0ACC3MS51_9PEZI|nr:hypothetical protein LTR37_015929 [Vermiconidia calcicola]
MVSQEQLHRRKRSRYDSFTADEQQQPSAKRSKTSRSRYSAQFWDPLSKVPLTRRALQEFDRRTKLGQSTPAVGAKKAPAPRRLLRSGTRRLKNLAKNGGPDLSKLRGYADTPTSNAAMSQSSSQQSKRKRASSTPKSRTSDKTKTTTYSAELVQKAIDNGVYPKGYRMEDGKRPPNPDNIVEIRDILIRHRPSLSPSRFSENAFEEFQDSNERATSEGVAMAQVIPTITGLKEKQFYSAGNIPFYRLAELDPELSAPNPAKYYGAPPKQIHKRVRGELDQYIIPSNATNRPVAPNFFLEGNSASGKPHVAQRQAMYDGWAGARGMHHLQNYGSSSLMYDSNAYTMEATYSDGQLKMYATHPRESASGGTEYYMTQLETYAMTGNANSFRGGAAAYRNAREWTQRQRDLFIADANATALRMSTERVASVSQTESHAEASSTVAEGSFSSETSADELALDSQSTTKKQRASTEILLSG